MASNGILAIGHGTPSDAGTRAFLEILRFVEGMAGETPVAVGFMEFASPTILDGVKNLAERGVSRIAAVPVFLSSAGHTANDIPPMIEEARKAFPNVIIQLTPHVGGHVKTAELSTLRYKESLVGRAEISAEDTVAVIAAHGSPEPEAFVELEKFARARGSLTPVGRIVPCFSQLGKPQLKDVLPKLAEEILLSSKNRLSAMSPTGRNRIVVQPHFLLRGRLIDSIGETVAKVAKDFPEIDWIVTEPLGCHRLLGEAVLELGSEGLVELHS
jgi:sirohydrochlorin ferrochelatase